MPERFYAEIASRRTDYERRGRRIRGVLKGLLLSDNLTGCREGEGGMVPECKRYVRIDTSIRPSFYLIQPMKSPTLPDAKKPHLQKSFILQMLPGRSVHLRPWPRPVRLSRPHAADTHVSERASKRGRATTAYSKRHPSSHIAGTRFFARYYSWGRPSISAASLPKAL